MSLPRGGACAERVARYFADRYLKHAETGGPYKMTPRGAWATSRPEALLWFFQKLRLESYALFGDLGCGDGVAVCCAALFTRALGIEADPELCRNARENAQVLGLCHRTAFVCADFLDLRFHPFDVLYIYPDKPLDPLVETLQDWTGVLWVYGPHFPPRGLKSLGTHTWRRENLTVYTRG